MARLVKQQKDEQVSCSRTYIVDSRTLKDTKLMPQAYFKENVMFFQQVQTLQYKMSKIFYLKVFERIRQT